MSLSTNDLDLRAQFEEYFQSMYRLTLIFWKRRKCSILKNILQTYFPYSIFYFFFGFATCTNMCPLICRGFDKQSSPFVVRGMINTSVLNVKMVVFRN